MKTRPALIAASLTAALAAAGACGGNRLLVGVDPDGGTPNGSAGAGPTGSAGTGQSGTAGVTGSAGSTGTPGTGSAGSTGAIDAGGTIVDGSGTMADGGLPPVKPLAISGLAAITRIAQVLWQAPADGAVLTQAEQGAFTTINDLYPAIQTMLADPRAAVGVGAFYRWWLDLDVIATITKDTTMFPAYTPALQADMANETETFGVNVTLAMNGSFQTLMTAPFSFINADLAAIYGVSGVTGTDLRQVALDPTQRAGLLTQPGLQALGSYSYRNSPSSRGPHILREILCVDVPAPPANIAPLAAPAPGVTLRATLAADVSPPECEDCHVVIDPPGLAFETFDAIGRFRTTDNGAPVDVSNLTMSDLSPSLPGSTIFSGPIQLAEDLALSVTVQQCMTKQWLAFALGTTADSFKSDELWMPAYQAFTSAQLNLKALIVAVLTSDTFLAPN